MLSGILSDLRSVGTVCDGPNVVEGRKKIQICEIPEVKEFYDTQRPR